MNKINPIMFIVPIIALLSSLCSYLYFIRKAKEKSKLNHLIITILILGFVSNFVWELLQIPLYRSMGSDNNHILLCALGSVADAIMVIVLYFIASIFFKDFKWITNLNFLRIISVMIIGGLGATISEKWHVSQGNWNYSDAMPIIPVFNVGLSPVLQFILLPIVIYYISGRIVFKFEMSKRN